MGDGLIGQFHIGRHAPGHRHAQDAAFHEPRPFACGIDRVLQSDLILTVKGFSNRAGHGHQCTQTVVAEIRTVGWIDADRGLSPLFHGKIKVPQMRHVLLTFVCYFIRFSNRNISKNGWNLQKKGVLVLTLIQHSSRMKNAIL